MNEKTIRILSERQIEQIQLLIYLYEHYEYNYLWYD